MHAQTVLDVRWRVSWWDLVRGLPADLAPHAVVIAVGLVWLDAERWGGSGALAPLGLVLLATQALAIIHLAASRLPSRPSAERQLVVRDTGFVVRDDSHDEELVAPVTGVVDVDGVVRVQFADGRAVEVPWRACSNAELRRLRRELRRRTGAPGEPPHVPVRRVGNVLGRRAWPHPLLALLGAGLLGSLPWLSVVAAS